MSDRRIRVLDFRGTYKGGGGPDKTILLSAASHDKNRFFILVTYLRDPSDREFEIHERAQKLGINYIDVPDANLFDLSCLLKLKRIIEKHRIHILHAHDDKTLLYGWALKHITRNRITIIYTCHSHPMFSKNDFNNTRDYIVAQLRQRTRIFLIRQFQKPIIAVSKATKKFLADDGIDESLVLYNGIETDYWKRSSGRPTLRQELNLDDDHRLIGTVARLAPEKDFTTFFKVAKKVHSVFPKARFVIVGDGVGDELANGRKQASELGLGKIVHFMGHRNDLLDVYASLDIFLMTSIYENMPNTILEAMSMETPIVSTRVGGVPEMIQDNVHGFLCPPRDHDALAKHILMLLTEPDLYNRFRSAARKRVEEKFSFSNRLKKMEAIYSAFAKGGL